MIWIFLHPGDRRLNQFTDDGLRLAERRRVAAHLIRCRRCRQEVESIHTLGDSLRAIPTPGPRAELLARIAATLHAGEAVILPDPLPLAPRRWRWGALTRIAALLAVLLAASLLIVETPSLTAYRTALEIAPAEPSGEGRYRVDYDGGLHSRHQGGVLLRARLFNGHGRIEHQTLATLVPGKRGRFTGEFSLPDTIAYAILAVEDTTSGTIDFNLMAPWEILARDRRGHPLFEALRAKAREEIGRNRLAGLKTAQLMTELYPERVESWYTLYSFERTVWGAAASERLRAAHHPRLVAFERELGNGQEPDATELAALTFYSLLLGELARGEYWQEQLIRNAPLHPIAVTLRVQGLEREYSHEPERLLAELERLWTGLGAERRDVAAAALAAAGATGDRAAILRWADRYTGLEPENAAWVASRLISIPATRMDGIQRLRTELERRDRTDIESRELYESAALQRRRDGLRVRALEASLGAALIAAGDKDAGLQLLRDVSETAWDVDVFRTGAEMLLSQGDTLAALELLIPLAVDPATEEETREVIRTMAYRHNGAAQWDVLSRTARERMRQQLLEEATNRPLRRYLQVVDIDGGRHELGSLLNGQVTLVSLWSCACGTDESDNRRFGALVKDLAAVGVRVVVVASEVSPRELELYLRAGGVDLPVYADNQEAVAWEFRKSGTPQHFLVGPEGTIRFEYTTMDDAYRQALALLPAAQVGGY